MCLPQPVTGKQNTETQLTFDLWMIIDIVKCFLK